MPLTYLRSFWWNATHVLVTGVALRSCLSRPKCTQLGLKLEALRRFDEKVRFKTMR